MAIQWQKKTLDYNELIYTLYMYPNENAESEMR